MSLDLMRKKIDDYYAFLKKNGNAMKIWKEFHKVLENNNVIYGGIVTPTIIAPYFLSKSQYHLLKDAAKHISSVIDKMADLYLHDPNYAEYFHINSELDEMIAMNPYYRSSCVISRWDAFIDGDSLKFVEFNADSAAGLGYGDIIDKNFLQIPEIQQIVAGENIIEFHRMQTALDVMLDCYEEFCSTTGKEQIKQEEQKRKPNIAIVDYYDIPVIKELEIWREFYRGKGHKAEIIDPRDIFIKNGQVYGIPVENHDSATEIIKNQDVESSFEIHIVYRRFVSYEVMHKLSTEELQPFLNAYENGLICVINSFRSNFASSKGVFALMSDPKNSHHFTKEENNAINKYIPWTRLLKEQKTTYRGKVLDLCAYIKANRNDFIIKAARSRGGRDVILGKDETINDAEWAEIIDEKVRNGGWVVQTFVNIPEMEFPAYNNENIQFRNKKINLNLFVITDKLGGIVTRISDESIINIRIGGGLLPTFIVDSD